MLFLSFDRCRETHGADRKPEAPRRGFLRCTPAHPRVAPEASFCPDCPNQPDRPVRLCMAPRGPGVVALVWVLNRGWSALRDTGLRLRLWSSYGGWGQGCCAPTVPRMPQMSAVVYINRLCVILHMFHSRITTIMSHYYPTLYLILFPGFH